VKKPTIDICKYGDAPWAPKVSNGSFRWAYRIVGPAGEIVACACNGNKQYARTQAQKMMKRVLRMARTGLPEKFGSGRAV